MQKIMLIGNLTKDPTMRTVNIGGVPNSVCDFSIAVNERVGQEPKVTYYNISAWRGSAESCHRYLTRGRKIYVEGTPRLNMYVGNDGKPRANIEVSASYIEFLSSRNDENQQQNTQPAQPHQNQPAAMPNYDAPVADPNAGFAVITDDQLPF